MINTIKTSDEMVLQEMKTIIPEQAETMFSALKEDCAVASISLWEGWEWIKLNKE